MRSRLALAAVLTLAGWTAAFGQLGETPAEIARRFGAPVRHNARVRGHEIIGGASTAGDVHVADGCYIRVVYGRGACVQVEYSPKEGALSSARVDALLTTAAAGSRWQRSPGGGDGITFYRRVDSAALASWTAGPDGTLLIAADESGALWRKLLQREVDQPVTPENSPAARSNSANG